MEVTELSKNYAKCEKKDTYGRRKIYTIEYKINFSALKRNEFRVF